MSRAARLHAYRDSIPTVKKNCAHCNSEFETKFGIYCSAICKTKAHREKKKAEARKDYICYYCGSQITAPSFYKFCNEDHGRKFQTAKDRGKPILLKINNKTTIQTKKYDSIPEVVRSWQAHVSRKI